MEIGFLTVPFQVCRPIDEPSCLSAMHCELRMQVDEGAEAAQSRMLEVTTMVVNLVGNHLYDNKAARIHILAGDLRGVTHRRIPAVADSVDNLGEAKTCTCRHSGRRMESLSQELAYAY